MNLMYFSMLRANIHLEILVKKVVNLIYLGGNPFEYS